MLHSIEQLQHFFDTAPSIKLLRQRSAPLVLSFFYRLFKEEENSSVPELDFLLRLADFLEHHDLEEEVERDTYEARAKALARKWSSPEHHFLLAKQDEQNELVYELSSYSEKVLQWLESLQDRAFVGTESRFKAIFQQIQELLAYTNADVQQRIEELEAQKASIEAEIAQIRQLGEVDTFDDYQIKSRLHDINGSSKALLGDFKEVEENFKQITRAIYQRHTDPNQRKGGILEYTFDALDQLRESDQGRSFYAFRDFLFSKSDKDAWQDMTQQLERVLDERYIHYDIRFLQQLKQRLFWASEKVVKANTQMSEKLTRIISERELAERLRVKKATNRIKALALEWAERKEQPQAGITLHILPSIQLPTERKLQIEQQETQNFTETPPLHEQVIEKEALLELAQQIQVDSQVLRQHIQQALQKEATISLGRLVKKHPLAQGLAELLTYVHLAAQNPKTVFEESEQEYILFDEEQRKYLQVPKIIFTA